MKAYKDMSDDEKIVARLESAVDSLESIGARFGEKTSEASQLVSCLAYAVRTLIKDQLAIK